ncbi:hypothetical protein N7476_004925 [Penicillium atrosanguineum]|uniref:Uncharacterized protein n=1 Tax=Penicillium atrosanguineum TaxID=1132637 RepID=A0A9W9U5N1_9EURO|nr:hypothetical protein N7476_004925 [Penicillium atrosanguineum]
MKDISEEKPPAYNSEYITVFVSYIICFAGIEIIRMPKERLTNVEPETKSCVYIYTTCNICRGENVLEIVNLQYITRFGKLVILSKEFPEHMCRAPGRKHDRRLARLRQRDMATCTSTTSRT